MFYEKADDRVERIVRLVERCDDRFVAQLAVYTRQKMNLRSVPLMLVVDLALTPWRRGGLFFAVGGDSGRDVGAEG
ncbi:MAG: hypothetical protein LIP02_12245 [Bacteroidales bacterium]|nr:hypothetical protein [Bacteroidales bacterium]